MPFPKTPAIFETRSIRPGDLQQKPAETLVTIYAWMQLARLGDNRILELFRQGLLRGTVTGGQGNEAFIIPLALLADKAIDVVSFTQRGFGGHQIWGGHFCEHLNQYFANAESPTKAREGNIHHGDPKNRSLPMISHLGAMLGPVLGMTDSQRRFGREAVGFGFFGDGGSSTGDVHESMNLASLLSLPVVFVIENNRYAYSTPLDEQHARGTELWKRAAAYGIEGIAIDATDVEVSVRTLERVIAKARRESRPMLVEAHIVRLRGHAAYDTCDYLKPGENEEFLKDDPMPKARARAVAAAGAARIDAVDAEIAAFVEACVTYCLAVPRPNPAGMEADLFAPAEAPYPWKPTIEGVTENLTMAQALNRALRKILAERPESVVIGQDIGLYGGAFKVTEGLLKEFGRPRVFNVPLAESACTGYALGMSMGGHRVIEEFQFADFATEATTQIALNAATMHFRSGAAAPLVYRLPCGGGLTFGSFHSQELESFFLAMPGLKALYPSNPQDAFNALLAAYEDGNPVLLFEHKGLYRRARHSIAWDPAYRDVWKPTVLRRGDYATLLTYGEMVLFAAEVCEYFAAEYERPIELIDLRCLAPLDLAAAKASLERTGRLIVLHEGRRTHGFGAEIVSRLTEGSFPFLKAAPLRIASLDLPVPFAPELEHEFRPTKETIIEAISKWMET